MIKKYTKKPVVVEAVQFLYDMGALDDEEAYGNDVCDFAGKVLRRSIKKGFYRGYYINTIEGRVDVHNGDYIVKDSVGEFYPVKKEIFEETYEEVE